MRLLGRTATVRHSKIVTRHLLAVKIFVWVLYFHNLLTLCTMSDTASSLGIFLVFFIFIIIIINIIFAGEAYFCWGLNPQCHSCMLNSCDCGQTLWWSHRAWRGARAVPRLCIIPRHSHYNRGKITEKPVRVAEKCLAEQRCERFVVSIGDTIFRAASTGLLTLITLPALQPTWINPRSA
jgi:hypothetical protein